MATETVADPFIIPLGPIAIGLAVLLAGVVLFVWLVAGDRRRSPQQPTDGQAGR